MKILHIVYSLLNGGIETMLINVANEQVMKHDVSIMIINDIVDNRLISQLNKTVNVIRIRRNLRYKFDIRLLLVGLYVYKMSPDVIHMHDLSILHFLPFKLKGKWIATKHNTRDVRMKRTNLKKIDCVIAISKSVKKILEMNDALIDKNVLCYNGVNFKLIKQKTQYSKSLKRIVSVGRLEFPVKGQDVIIRAVYELVKKGMPVELEIWGDGYDKKSAQDLVSYYGMADYIKIVGDVSHEYVEQHLKDFDLFIQASYLEGFGLSAVEAIGAGLPCVLSNVEGHSEVSEDISTAFLFRKGDVNDLVDVIHFVSYRWNEVISSCSENSYLIRERFSIENMVSNLEEIYSF